jgi:hypothetical protein
LVSIQIISTVEYLIFARQGELGNEYDEVSVKIGSDTYTENKHVGQKEACKLCLKGKEKALWRRS